MYTLILIILTIFKTVFATYSPQCRLRQVYNQPCKGASYCIGNLICNNITDLCDCPKSIDNEYYWNGTDCVPSLPYNQTCSNNLMCQSLTKNLICNNITDLCDCPKSIDNEYYWNDTDCVPALSYNQSCSNNLMCRSLTENTICSDAKCTCDNSKVWSFSKCSVPCENNWTPFDSKCYAFFSGSGNGFNWYEANNACAAQNYSLATVPTFSIFDFFNKKLIVINGFYWIGAISSNETYTWIDNSTFIWNSSYIFQANGNLPFCLYMQPSDYKLKMWECIKPLKDYVCEYKPELNKTSSSQITN